MDNVVLAKRLSNPILFCFLDDLKLLFHRKASTLFSHNLNLSDKIDLLI